MAENPGSQSRSRSPHGDRSQSPHGDRLWAHLLLHGVVPSVASQPRHLFAHIHLHDGAACVPIILQGQNNELPLQQKIQQATLHEVEVIFRGRGSGNLHECGREAPVPMMLAFQSNNASQLHSALVMATDFLKQQGLRYSIAEVNVPALPVLQGLMITNCGFGSTPMVA